MANIKETTDEKRKQFNKLADSFFPNLSSPELVRIALLFEQNLE